MNEPPPPPQADKLGLALSGGGHRAAFFHIGVLAKLAELGLLRKIEVISTVSGGSIVGALYYLRLKAKLDEKDELDDADFFEIVREVADDYQRGASKNLRARVLLSPLANLRYAFPNYTRTDRMGELYEEHFYKDAWTGVRHDDRIAMCDLVIKPGGDETFKPSEGNPERETKVPVLLLNATTLNTGHNWRFEAQYMGEPLADDADSSDVDKNLRLRRTAWDALPAKGSGRFAIDYRHFPLGAAVASSACFPLGFPPKALPRLFERAAGQERAPMTVQLVDGGVHDNQGIEGLLDADREHHACTHLIVSDASGQMADIDKPSGRVPSLLPRIISIEGDVDREQRVLRAMEGCDRAATPPEERLAFMHLQTGLSSGGLSPKGVDAPYEAERRSDVRTGVERRAQQLLARVRTDLDAFSEVEAYSLMLDGYRICAAIVPAAPAVAELAGRPSAPPDKPWRFLDVAPQLDSLPEAYLRRLRVAEARFFKPARLAIGALAASRRKSNPAAKESAHRLRRERWTSRAFGAFWLAVAGALAFAGASLDGHQFNAVWVYVAGLAIVGGLVLYAAPAIPGLHRVSRGFFSILMPLLVWPFLPLLALLQLAGGRLHLRYGRVPSGSPAGARGAVPEAPGAHVPR